MSNNDFYDTAQKRTTLVGELLERPPSAMSGSDDEIAAVMAEDEGGERNSPPSPAKKELNSRKISTAIGNKRAETSNGGGERVVARCDLDGYYYQGRAVTASVINGKIIVDFDSAPLARCAVAAVHVIAYKGAVSRPFIRLNDTVLVLIKNGLTGLHCYVPGVVALAPLNDQEQAKCYSVVAYNRRTVTAFRYQLIRISESKFSAAVSYICERAKLMGLRPLAPLTRKQHYGIKQQAQQSQPTNNRSKSTSGVVTNRRSPSLKKKQPLPPRRLSPISSIKSANSDREIRTLNKNDEKPTSVSTSVSNSSRTLTPVDKAIQASSFESLTSLKIEEPPPPTTFRVEHVMIDRALSPITFIAPTEPQVTETVVEPAPVVVQHQQQVVVVEPVPSSSSESSDESDDDGVIRPERRRRRFESTAPLDGTFSIGQTVLARSSDDGWFYRWKVEADLGNGAYALRNKSDPDDTETAWKEHIFHLPGSKGDDDEEIEVGDCVIAKRPDFQQTYCPASVEGVDRMVTLRFCDQLVVKVDQSNCVKISQKIFNEAIMFIKHCDDRWVGERVVVLNPPREQGGFEPMAGNYVIGVIRQREEDRRYLVELAPEVVLAAEDHDNDDEPFMIRQSIDHIFGRFTKSRKLATGDFVLAPVDRQHNKRHGCIVYLPGTVRAVKRNNKLLTVKLVNGLIVDSLKAKDVFWLRAEYFEASEQNYRSNYLPQALKGSAEPTTHVPAVVHSSTTHSGIHSGTQSPRQTVSPPENADWTPPTILKKPNPPPPPPKIVIEDFDQTFASSPTRAESPRLEKPPTPKTNPSPSPRPHKAVKDDVAEMVKKCEAELENGGGVELVVRWIREGTVKCSERLGDMAAQYDGTLAKAIYLRTLGLEKKALEGIDSKENARQMLESLVAVDPVAAVELARRVISEPLRLIEVDEVAHVFLSSQLYHQQFVDFLLDAIDDDDPNHVSLETQLLEVSASLGKEQLNRVLLSGRFTKLERTRVLILCKKAGLYERYLEQLQFVDDIKGILGEHAFEMDMDWLVKFFEGFGSDDMFDCIEEMLLSNKSGKKNLPVVLRLIKKYHKSLDVNNIIELLERLQMTNELFYVLQTVVASSKNPIMTTKLMEVACLVDRVADAEQICRDSNAVFFAEVVWEFLAAAKLPKTGRLMALMADRFSYVEQFVKFCHENNQYRLLEAFVSRVNPARLHQVVDALTAIGADQLVIDRVVTSVAPPPPKSFDTSSTNGYIE